MKIGYYPGCSLHGSAAECDQSLKAIAPRLGLELEELRDWACCGASSAHATSHLLSLALPARTLALAEDQHAEALLAPCAACYNRLAVARHEIGNDAALLGKIQNILDRKLRADVPVRNVVDVLRELAPALREKAVRPLAGLKVACYYGCLLLRPAEALRFDDPEQPTSMEEVVAATGATAVEWPMRLDCCGGSFSLARTGSVVRLGREILASAKQAGAAALIVACPMCHSNLDFRQKAIEKREGAPFQMPVIYITQLVGLALGLSVGQLGLDRHFVDAAPLLNSLGPATAAAAGEA